MASLTQDTVAWIKILVIIQGWRLNFELFCDPNDRIEQLERRIAKLSEFHNEEEAILVHNHQVLQGHKKVSDYIFTDHSTILCYKYRNRNRILMF